MGTSIECFIPKEKDYSTKEIQKKFKTLYEDLSAEFLQIEINGQFIRETSGNWRIQIVTSENEPEYILGEGDGFELRIYKNVVILSCIERIGSFYREDQNISSSLYRIFSAFAKEFRDSNLMLIASGGVGDTDHIGDMAYYGNADFEELCQKMRELHGEPTKELKQLSEIIWYFQD